MALKLTTTLMPAHARVAPFKFSPVATRAAIRVPFRAYESMAMETQMPPRSSVVMMAKAKKAKGGGGGGDAPAPKKAKAGAAKEGPIDLETYEEDCKKDVEERMLKCLEAVQNNFNTIRTGRANPAILDRIFVDSYGTPTPLKNLASITVPEATCLLITPFDKAAIKDIEKALANSDIGISPSNDGEKIRLNIPALDMDRRKELVKNCSKFGEDGKIAIRNVRQEVKKKSDKVDLPKDNKKQLDETIQKTTDTYIKKVDDMVKVKSADLLKV
eukprot:gene22717-29880_t